MNNSRPSRSAALITSLIILFLATTVVPAQGPTQRIRFKKGRSAAIVKGRLVNTKRVAEAWQNYVLKVSEGQTLTLRLTSAGDRAGFRLTFPNGELAEGLDGNPGHTEWTSTVPASGDCQIEVSHGSAVQVTPYRLEVAVR